MINFGVKYMPNDHLNTEYTVKPDTFVHFVT